MSCQLNLWTYRSESVKMWHFFTPSYCLLFIYLFLCCHVLMLCFNCIDCSSDMNWCFMFCVAFFKNCKTNCFNKIIIIKKNKKKNAQSRATSLTCVPLPWLRDQIHSNLIWMTHFTSPAVNNLCFPVVWLPHKTSQKHVFWTMLLLWSRI